jgi:hypothetical protein
MERQRGQIRMARRRRGLARSAVIGLLALAGVGGVGLGVLAAGAVTPSGGPRSSLAVASGAATPFASPEPSAIATPTPSATPTPTPIPTPTPVPTPTMVPAPLTGRMVREDVAKRHAIAVMVDDHRDARPQSGFTDASIVWQAPAEGGIPRYMLIFQDRVAPSVGPVRSARQYYIAWAAEWRAVYAHVGGSPQAMQTLRQKGRGQLVYNADEFRWGGIYFHRTRDRFAPHNVYASGKELRALAKRVGAADKPMKAAWRFAPDAPLDDRPVGGSITVAYSYNTIVYRYDRKTNTYLRSVTGEAKQTDRGTKRRVAPKNVVVMVMSFGPLNDGSRKHRLEAQFVGKGTAWIATNGKTIKGTWRKRSITDPTRFYDKDGHRVTLTVGQTFIQVMPKGSRIVFKAGKTPPTPDWDKKFRGERGV